MGIPLLIWRCLHIEKASFLQDTVVDPDMSPPPPLESDMECLFKIKIIFHPSQIAYSVD